MAQPKPKPGAPAAGPGGQKAGGTAVPPKQPKPPPPPKAAKPPAGAPAGGAGNQKGGSQPAAGKPVQPLTQKPGQAPRPLNPAQKTQVQKAAQGGTLDQYLASHPGVAQHYGKVQAAGTAGQQGKYQTLQQQNQAAKAGQPAATGAPAAGAGGGKPNAPGAQPTPAPTPAATPAADTGGGGGGAAAPTTFEDAFNAQYGQGAAQQFGPSAWTGPNPIETAQAAAQRALGTNLADVRARYAGSGFGNSAREALAEGTAVGDVSTNLGANLAQLGTQVRGSDLDRLANMFSTAGEQDIQQKQIGADLNQQLANLGTGITGVGASEQQIPGADLITTLLTNMSRQPTFSQGAQKQPRK